MFIFFSKIVQMCGMNNLGQTTLQEFFSSNMKFCIFPSRKHYEYIVIKSKYNFCWNFLFKIRMKKCRMFLWFTRCLRTMDLQLYMFMDSHHTHVCIKRTVFIYLEDLHSISTLQLCNRHDGAGRLDATNERHRLLLQVGQKLVQIKIQNILLNVHYIFVNKWIPIIIAWKTTTERKENGDCNAWTIKRWHLVDAISGNAKKKKT